MIRSICTVAAAMAYSAGVLLAAGATPVQGFETAGTVPKPWVVGMPDEQASTSVSADHASEGKRSLKLDYQFDSGVQYLGVPIPVEIRSPINTLLLQLLGDKSGCGYGVYLIDASGETHKYRDAGKTAIDFEGWKEVVIDVNGGHETWGGDKNGKIDYPITHVTFELGTPGRAVKSQVYIDALAVHSGAGPMVTVVSPEYRSEISGDTPIAIAAEGFPSVVVTSWKPGGRFGSKATVATVKLDEKGNGSFVFPAGEFPKGPITVTISGDNGRVKNNCYLQLYNKGGVAWNAGMPADPSPAKGLKLLYADEFDAPLSIGDDAKSKYYDHKPPRGETDFSSIPFVSHDKPNTPFAQMDTYLRIRASEKTKSAGIISSLKSDGSGFKTKVPAYFECRFIGPNAIGSWPAFWLMTDHMSDGQDKNNRTPCDELDIIEAYGGEGPKAPNSFDKYMISPHCWNQGDKGHEIQEAAVRQLKRPTEMSKVGMPSTWYETFHTYGCLVTETETIYYCDDIEVGRHATLPLCKEKPLFFMINLATGGGWPVDLSHYDGTIDMYVDYVRVYGLP